MELNQAIRIVCDMMQADPEFRKTWEDGIANAFNEEYAQFRAKQKSSYVKGKEFPIIARRAAERYLNDLISAMKY